ncbi:MAG: hypothetical protein HN534_04230 [Euryarchaeota archaeon]|jgi:pantoate kinase|nr:hypothetical protein [Euryarchaeota archaeon]MBT3654119.1 hypothetical protein [Euryarchaeota archaeon]MBT3757036.1 hypothetical protein [Euryarchaeota archaeon]MBT4050427.1 hypothetical protein [Euryarchaeota archaeon]MBT4346889.1 hypothetical protein [Euryarchaeota archaeon]|tara:strand:+ start:2433 stop:3410 length:978 start_codon:yes stop_codon:yes gene_type:complete
MSVLLGRGMAGAHITLIFTVEDQTEDPIEQGSLGAGFSLHDGIEAIARGIEGDFGLQVRFLDCDGDESLYREVLETLAFELPSTKNYAWEIAIRMALPTSQGFGMSAAGAVAAAAAFLRAMGEPHEESMRRSFFLAHRIERKRSSGLGDVTALSAGGVERRIRAGAPFSGELLDRGPGRADGWTEHTPVLLAWRKKSGKHTSIYINDPKWKQSISDAGNAQMASLSQGDWKSSRWNELIIGAEKFAEESGLLTDSERTGIIDIAKKSIDEISASDRLTPLLCMLGESVVIVPSNLDYDGSDFEKLNALLNEAGLNSKISRIGSLF